MDVKFLDNFIIQSQTDNLKTKSLPTSKAG